jgi:O-antigen/teichoic acid export membrane protein
MSRIKRFIHGFASSIIVLFTNGIYTLCSVPLALHFLSREEFGVWAVLMQVCAFFNLVDFGLSSSFSRILIDHKDDRAHEKYYSLIATGILVAVVQSFLVFAIGALAASFLPDYLNISPAFKQDFGTLLLWQSGITAFSFLSRTFINILYAHQRLDIVNYISVLFFLINYCVLWFAFMLNMGLSSFVWANFASFLATGILYYLGCGWLGFLPHLSNLTRPTLKQFVSIFHYGRDLFLVGVGTQLIIGSQAIILARYVNLETAALWTVGTRAFNILCQIIWRIFDSSAPSLAEMIVRDEDERLRIRYRSIVVLTISLSAFGAVSFSFCNDTFMQLWTKGKMSWSTSIDVLLGIWLILSAVIHVYNGLALLTKEIGFMRWIYFLEGAFFVVLASWQVQLSGIAGMILISLISSVIFSLLYGIYRVRKYFGFSLYQLALEWFLPGLKLSLIFIPGAMIVWWFLQPASLMIRFWLQTLFCFVFGGILFLRYGLPSDVQVEVLQRFQSSFLKRIFGAKVNG